ncbi:hypothetical protein [Aeromicrobium sp. CTD01-1L150]|uniref:hypothetical protein n=1 Tax=Aeromicrobium sp. CTD01-1L150 TaxID=3341830 RepID=UPI0035C1A5B2
MKESPWFWPALGVGTAVITLVASYFILRFAPSPGEIATLVLAVLLVVLATLGYLATKRGRAATFVAIALVLPYLLIGTVAYAALERASSELSSIFDDESEPEEDLFDEESFHDEEEPYGDEGATYGSDPTLDALWDGCEAGDADACNELYAESPGGSEYEAFAEANGGGF